MCWGCPEVKKPREVNKLKKYRVEFTYLETDGTVRAEPMTVPLSPSSASDHRGHLVGPWITESRPFEGELAEEDVAILRMLPGKEYSPHWRFTVVEVK